MAHSLSQQANLTCPDCGAAFEAEVWLIVDGDERPDLLARVLNGTLQDITCPNGHTRGVDEPLLLLRQGTEQPLLFSPAQATTVEQDHEQARELVDELRKRLGAAWQDGWVEDGIQALPQPVLRALLNGKDLEVALEASQAEIQADLPPALQEALDDVIAALTDEGVTIDSPVALQQVLAERPDLQARLAHTIPSKGMEVPEQFRTSLQAAQNAVKRYLQNGQASELDTAIAAWTRIIDHPSFANAPELFRLAAANDAGGIHLRRYWSRGDLADLDRALELWEETLARTAPNSPDRASYLNNLGNGLRDRYARTGQLADLERAIEAWEDAVARTASDSPDRAGYLNNLGTGLRDRYARTGRLGDLERTIAAYEDAVARTGPDSLDRAGYQSNLGLGLRDRYARTGQMEDLERAIAAWEDAVTRAVPDSPDLAGYLNNLGTGLRARYTRTGQMEDLERAIAAWEDSVARTTPNSPNRASRLNNLGNGLRTRYARTGELEDLERAIAAWEDSVARTTPNSPNRASRLNSLGTGLRARYAHTGQMEDLERAIEAWEDAITHSDPDSPDRVGYQNNLGNGLSDRYASTGRLEYLERAIAAWENAVTHSNQDSPNRSSIQNNLGTGLRDRYARTGHLKDLERAITAWEDAVTHTAPDSPNRAARLSNLGTGLSDRYARTGQLEDLERAIEAWEDSVTRTAPDSPDRAARLNNLGTGLSDRYARTGQLEDLERAIEAWEGAVNHTSPDSPNQAAHLNNLGTGLRVRYTRSGQMEDLERAIATWEDSVARTTSDSPDRAARLSNLGTGLSDRYARTGQLEDLERAIAAWEDAVATLERALLFSSVAYALGQQSRWAGLFARTVTALTLAGRPARALAIAEGSKSRLLAGLLGRGELPAPDSAPPDLVAREQALAAQLNALDASQLAGNGVAEQSRPEQGSADRQLLVSELQDIWQEMEQSGDRAAQEYVALRRGAPPSWASLSELAASLTPEEALLSLFDTSDTLLLFLVRPGENEPRVIEVSLDRDELVYDYLASYETEVLGRAIHRNIGRPLTQRWRALGQPLLGPLLPYLDGISHLVIAPEGIYHQLPLHALWIDENQNTLIDHCAVSYIPALNLLDRLRRREPITSTDAVVFGYTSADASTRAGEFEQDVFESEARDVAARFDTPAILREEASAEALRRATIHPSKLVHLSCHGYFSHQEPLLSGVALAGGVFTAGEWMSHRMQADLVTLSACQTGRSGSLGGDELVGLSQAILYAGASSLVLSLWNVVSYTTMKMMVDFYQRLNGEDALDKAEALRQTMLAMKRGDLVPELAEREDIDLSDPYYWAPFVLMGEWRNSDDR